MTYFLAQVALLLLAAYLLGTFLGCMTHRLFGYVFASGDASAQTGGVTAKTAQPVIETSDHSAALHDDQSRFEKALSHGPAAREELVTEAVSSKTADPTPAPIATPVVKLDTPSFTPVEKPEPTDIAPASTATSKTATVTPITAPAKETPPSPAPTPVTAKPVTPAVTPPEEGEKYRPVTTAAAIAAAAVTARASATTASEPTPKSTPGKPAVPPTTRDETETASAPAAPAPQGGPDDLTRIRHIDGALQDRLNNAGVTRYQHIASWQADDVANYDGLLDSPGRVSRENWIEQAQILSIGGATTYSRDRDTGSAGQPAGSASTTEKPPEAQSSSPAGAGVLAATAAAAAAATVSAQPSGTGTGKQETSKSSAGTSTSKADAGVMAATAAAAAAAAAATAISSRLPATESTKPAAPIATHLHEFEEVGTDPLHRIDGIDDRAAGLLNGHGFTRFEQISNWSRSDVSHFEELIGEPGRIGRERWVEQAQIFARGDTKPEGDAQPVPASKADATAIPVVTVDTQSASARESRPAREPRHRTGDDGRSGSGELARTSKLSGMRSVRSAALRGDRSASHGDRFDDLKRIRGVGVLIEKKLNSLGVTSYDQIANWTNDDMDHISGLLEFKGRIERENWVEQARILASGGHTEFSRRMERGQ